MNMKRLTAVLLALCLLYGAAYAETATGALRVIGGSDAVQAYQAQYPGREVEEIRPEYDDYGNSNIRELLLGGDWDVACIYTDACDLGALAGAGVLMDLSAVPAASGAVDGMYQSVRSAVTADGRLLGVPSTLWGLVMQFSFPATVGQRDTKVDLRAKLGFTDADTPRTFADLCSLAQRYMALPVETRRGTAFSADAVTGNVCEYFLDYLVTLYKAETCGAGDALTFDTPAFRTALAELDAMVAALKTDPKVRYDENGWLCGVINDVSSAVFNEDALFLHIGEGSAIPAELGVTVINAASEHPDEALAYLAISVENMSTEQMLQLYENIDYDALLLRSYDETIAAQIQQDEDQSVIDDLIRRRDAGDTTYFYTREEIQSYAEAVAPNLIFPYVPRIYDYPAVTEYARGKLDADGLIQQLDALVAESTAN